MRTLDDLRKLRGDWRTFGVNSAAADRVLAYTIALAQAAEVLIYEQRGTANYILLERYGDRLSDALDAPIGGLTA